MTGANDILELRKLVCSSPARSLIRCCPEIDRDSRGCARIADGVCACSTNQCVVAGAAFDEVAITVSGQRVSS